MRVSRLEFIDVAFFYESAGAPVFEGLSVEVSAGWTGIIGPNGAGKTTLFHLMSGFLTPDKGQIFCGDVSIAGRPPWSIARLGIGRLFQDVRVFEGLSSLENVLIGCPARYGENPVSALFRRRAIRLQEKELSDVAWRWLTFVGLKEYAATPARALSYGQRKLLAFARLLACDPRVLLLDEPTAGISPAAVPQLLELIKNLAHEKRTVLVIEHNMNVVFEIADWVYFIDEGQIAVVGTPNDVLGSPSVRQAYLGL